MFQIPPVPTWDGLHPLIIHFPIVLLLIAPLFLLIGAVLSPQRSKHFFICALILMVLGTASTFVAIATGEAAGKIASRTPASNRILEQHEQLAERTRFSFSILTLLFAGLLLLPRFLKREGRMFTTFLPMVFLVIYGGAAILLANTAHNGGRLVHEFGVQALVAPTPGEPAQISESGE